MSDQYEKTQLTVYTRTGTGTSFTQWVLQSDKSYPTWVCNRNTGTITHKKDKDNNNWLPNGNLFSLTILKH